MELKQRKQLLKLIGKLLFVSIMMTSIQSNAQKTINVYFVKLTEKDSSFTDTDILSTRAVERRDKYHISIDIKDYPVKKTYINQISKLDSTRVRYSLKWLNGLVVETLPRQVESIRALPFVQSLSYVGKVPYTSSYETKKFEQAEVRIKESSMHTKGLSPKDYGLAYFQNNQIGVTNLHQEGYNGENISVAVFDAGFKNITKIPGFTKHQANHKLQFGYDFVNMDNTLSDFDTHGTACASALGAYEPRKFIGSGPLASLILFKTENGKSEFPIEELNWCKAAEIADSIGVDIITSSLGYNQFDDANLNYTHSQLDGNTAYISRAAKTAVAKGIIVVNSAGNQGNSDWFKIGFPADTKEVLTVGAIDKNGQTARFSSRGNNASGDTKPDVSALGVRAAVANPNGTYNKGNGTSFSTPIVAGGVACLLQAYPELSPKEIHQLIRQTATRNNQPDSNMGYGIPRFDIAFAYQKFMYDSTINYTITNSSQNEFVIFNKKNLEIQYKLVKKNKLLALWPGRKKLAQEILPKNTKVFYIPTPIKYSSSRASFLLKIKIGQQKMKKII